MTLRDLCAELRREEALEQQQGMPPAARASVRARLGVTLAPRRASRVPLRMLAAAAVIGVVAVVVWGRWPQRQLGQLAVVHASAGLRSVQQAGGAEIEAGEATLFDERSGISLRNAGPLAFRREAAGLRIVRGTAELEVRRRPRGTAPAVVLVSGGAIEVMGTRFTLTQGQAGGTVTLHEGAIRFRPDRGPEVDLRPRQTLAWPMPPEPPGVSAAAGTPPPPGETAGTPPPPGEAHRAAAPAPGARRQPAPTMEELLQEVDVLRSRRQYEAAARQLRQALRTQPLASRERLSFELGSLLTYQLRDTRRACAHWTWHRAQYAPGRYQAEVGSAMASLKCGPRR
jgi:transmembrane sensor